MTSEDHAPHSGSAIPLPETIDEFLALARAGLKRDGPVVEESVLREYVAGRLGSEVQDDVRQKIATFLNWNSAYWKMRSEHP